ncbi:MAG TPA: polysaccharide deacetylase family protein [Gemmatimonadaceae bacterium]|nr:polysaccharide deacetylase family protein [Gemmatimonadaceae bacterium]
MALLVSIHDVTPALAPRVEALWSLCRERGVTPALLVVPNWHGDWPLAQHPAFVRWVRERADDGAEIFLHGERHDEVGSPRTLRDSWRAFNKTNREGEFLTLDAPAARERIDRGLTLFAQLGLTPIGFVPPAWLARDACYEAVAGAGLHFAEDDTAIAVLPRRRWVPSPVVRWSGRTPFRARASAVVADGRWRMQRHAKVMRIAFHPSDLDHPASARSATRTLERWLGDRQPARYRDLA